MSDDENTKCSEAVKPKEFWLIEEQCSNRALVRDIGEKWPDDIDGEPTADWKHFIEYSAYEAVCKERDLLALSEPQERLRTANALRERDQLQSDLAEQQKLHERTRELRDQEIDKLRAERDALLIVKSQMHNYREKWLETEKEVDEAIIRGKQMGEDALSVINSLTEKLAIAVEALEMITKDGCGPSFCSSMANKALAKIKGEK